MEGKAAYSFSTSGDSEQVVGFDCAQTETQRAERTAMARMEEPRLDDCSAAENWRRSTGRLRMQVATKAKLPRYGDRVNWRRAIIEITSRDWVAHNRMVDS